MSTPKKQRIAIWFIAVVLTFGTLGSFMIIALNIKNSAAEEAAFNKAYSQYQQDVSDQADELSAQYYDTFSQFASKVSTYDATSVTELATEDLLVGDGEEVTEDTDYSAYYLGWLSDGTIFDESISDGALETPLSKSDSLVDGWQKGVIGMKLGGVREITMPSDLGYGSDGYSTTIPADAPLKFIVMLIPRITDIEIPQEILDYYSSN